MIIIGETFFRLHLWAILTVIFSTTFLKFQAEMGLLILILMIFNMFGALVFIPSLTAILKPKFVKDMVMDKYRRGGTAPAGRSNNSLITNFRNMSKKT